MIGVIETDRGKRVEQILATDVTREQLADAVWSVERTHALQNDFIMELMERCNYYEDMSDKLRDENVKLRELVETMRVGMREMLGIMGRSSYTWGYCRYYGECLDAAEGIMRELGIEVNE